MSAPPASVLLEHHVCERTGLSRNELRERVRAGVFPKPRRNRNGAHCSWTVDDIEAWRRRNEWVERMRALFDTENDGMAEIDDALRRAREPYEVLARIRWARERGTLDESHRSRTDAEIHLLRSAMFTTGISNHALMSPSIRPSLTRRARLFINSA